MQWMNEPIEIVPGLVAATLQQQLIQGEVTWFVSGGSNVALQVQTLHILQKQGTDLSKLTILLVDERFGAVGHTGSNWQQLRDAGFMIDGPQYIAPFTAAETTLAAAVIRYEQIITTVLGSGSQCFAQLGMGSDGHTVGILPGSPAAEQTNKLVIGYEHAPYQRMTLSFAALRKLQAAALVAYGAEKHHQLAQLSTAVGLETGPVQIIKDIPSITIYTDYVTK